MKLEKMEGWLNTGLAVLATVALVVSLAVTQPADAQAPKQQQPPPAQTQAPAPTVVCDPVVDAEGSAVHHRAVVDGLCFVTKMEYTGLGRVCTKRGAGWDCMTTAALAHVAPAHTQRCGLVTKMPSPAELEKMVPSLGEIMKQFNPKSITLDDLVSGTIMKKIEDLSAEVLGTIFASKVPLEMSATFWSTSHELCQGAPRALPQYTVTFRALDQSVSICLMQDVGCVPMQSLSPEAHKHVMAGLTSIANTAIGKVLKEIAGKV